MKHSFYFGKENKICNLKYREEKNTHSEQQKEKECKKSDGSVRSLQDSFKHTNIHSMGVPEGEERKRKKLETYLNKMTEKFPTLV